jgi:MFS family permease
MRRAVELLRAEPRARVFFAALAQSSIGTGAGYVALLLVAYERFHSAWAISLVLTADLLPAVILGPVFGAAGDRWSRRTCMVVADAVRASAFAGLAVVGSFEATLALALLAGAGTALFTPSALAAVPGVVERRRAAAATSLYGALTHFGVTVGPALAGAMLLAGGPQVVLLANALTFALSALMLARLAFGDHPAAAERRSGARLPSLLGEARAGIRAAAAMRGVRVVILASTAALFCGGLFNVAELPFAKGNLGASAPGYAVLVALFGIGLVAGSLVGAGGGPPRRLKRRYLVGLLLMGTGALASGLAPAFGTALTAFPLVGFGNGLMLVYERLLIQTTVPDALMGRVFGTRDALASAAFAIAFLAAGAAVSVLGARGTIALSGLAGLGAWAASEASLHKRWRGEPEVPAGARVPTGAPG